MIGVILVLVCVASLVYVILNELDKLDTKRELDALLKYLSEKQKMI